MTSPALTSKETSSTAKREPYHLVSRSATMAVTASSRKPEAAAGREVPSRRRPGSAAEVARPRLYSRNSGAFFICLKASGSWAVKNWALSRACISRIHW